MNPYITPKFIIAVYLLVDHKQERTIFAAKCSEPTAHQWDNEAPKSEYTYMECALKAVTKMIEKKAKVEAAKIDPKPLDVHLYTSHPNVAKAVTRAFMLAHKQHFHKVDPVTELKKRGKDLDLYLPLIAAIVSLYAVVGGIKQVGHVGEHAGIEELYRDVRNMVKAKGVRIAKAKESCTALNDAPVSLEKVARL